MCKSFIFVFEGQVRFSIGLFLGEGECDEIDYDIHSQPYTSYSVLLYLGQ